MEPPEPEPEPPVLPPVEPPLPPVDPPEPPDPPVEPPLPLLTEGSPPPQARGATTVRATRAVSERGCLTKSGERRIFPVVAVCVSYGQRAKIFSQQNGTYVPSVVQIEFLFSITHR